MKATGIIRRIDDLGRVVIPKEIRRRLHIKEGDPLELYVTDEVAAFKKHSVLGEFGACAQKFANHLAKALAMDIVITNMDTVVAASKRELNENRLTDEFTGLLYKEKEISGEMCFCKDVETKVQYTQLIIVEGNVVGSINIVGAADVGNSDAILLKYTASLLSKVLED